MSVSVLPSILILDEDQEMRELLRAQVKSSGFAVLEASTAKDALRLLASHAVSLLMTNVKIPETNLVDFLKKVRFLKAEAELSVLALVSAGNQNEQNYAALAGVSDMLMKPFDRAALLNKVKALLKGKNPEAEDAKEQRSGRLTFKDLVLDVKSFDVFYKGERIKLTPNEFKLLQSLLENVGEILTRNKLIELVQGKGVAVIDRAVDTHIFALRKKLGGIGEAIETIRGEGYRIGSKLSHSLLHPSKTVSSILSKATKRDQPEL